MTVIRLSIGLLCICLSSSMSSAISKDVPLALVSNEQNVQYLFHQQNNTTVVLATSSFSGVRWLTVSNGRRLVHTVYAATDDRTTGTVQQCRINDNVREAKNFAREIRSRLAAATATATTIPVGKNDYDFERQRIECEKFLQSTSRSPLGEVAKSRAKRSYMIFPGTNWCGKGNTADYADHLGLNSQVDVCCRTHDHCPFAIEGFTSRFNTFNYRPSTLSHCDCDEQFKKCLKEADSGAASVVGKVYFNVVNTQCFDLKMEKVCSRRTWWGTCDKYTTQWVANVRSLGYY